MFLGFRVDLCERSQAKQVQENWPEPLCVRPTDKVTRLSPESQTLFRFYYSEKHVVLSGKMCSLDKGCEC